MAIRAHWAQIIDGIYLILLSNSGNRDDVMRVNESLPNGAIAILKREATYLASSAMVSETFLTCLRVAFVCSDHLAAFRAFKTQAGKTGTLRWFEG